MTTNNAKPFTNDIEYLASEIEHITARCAVMKVLRSVNEQHHIPGGSGILGHQEATATEEEKRQLAAAKLVEQAAVEKLHARLKATRDAGVTLALDVLCEEHGLNTIDRTTILLAAIPACSRDLCDDLDGISSRGYGSDVVTVEAVANYLELELADRIHLRRRFGVEAPLVKAALVTVDLGFSSAPQDWPEAIIKLTSKAFDAILGLGA